MAGPVETGFKKAVLSCGQKLRAALQRAEAKTVLPTSVLAPYIWYVLSERQSRAPTGAIEVFWSWFKLPCGMKTSRAKSKEQLVDFVGNVTGCLLT